MATEVSSENWASVAGSSPRISFSHDLSLSDLDASTAADERRHDASLPLDPSASTASDFDFSVSAQVSALDPSPADELFSGGKLLPVPIKTPSAPTPQSSSPMPPPTTIPPPAPAKPRKCGSLREIMSSAGDDDVENSGGFRRSPSQRSFWPRFGRSSSLNSFGSRSRLICPFPLLRSQSTGSSGSVAPNPATVRKPRTNAGSHSSNVITNRSNGIGACNDIPPVSPPSSMVSFRRSPSDTTARIYYYSGSSRRSCGTGVRISPILNVPAAGRVSVLSYLLCNCGDKSMRKGSAVTCSP